MVFEMVFGHIASVLRAGPEISGNVVAFQAFSNLLGNLSRLQFFEFLLPFLLFLAVFYGALRFATKDKLERSTVALISIVASFFILNYSGNVGFQIASFLTSLLGGSLILFSGILIVIIFLGLLGVKPEELIKGKDNKISPHGWAFILLLIFIGILIFIGAGGGALINVPSSIGGFTSNDIATLIFFLIIIAIAVWLLGQEEKKGE